LTVEKKLPIENIGDFEREKVMKTVEDLEHAANMLRQYISMSDELGKRGIPLPIAHQRLETLRYVGGSAGPDSSLNRLIKKADKARRSAKKAANQSRVSFLEIARLSEAVVVRGRIEAAINPENNTLGLDQVRLKAAQESVPR
jgi:hypothetical protein